MTKATFFVEEDKILTSLFEEGLENLHINKPCSEPMYSERLLTLLPDEYYKRIVVHDHFYLREEYGLRGIHLDTNDTEIPFGYKGHVSRTCQSVDELREAKKRSNYVFLRIGPDEPSGQPAPGYDALKAASRQGLIDRKVYAVGGVTINDVKMLRDLGFGGIVVSGDLWNRFNIHQGQDYKELIGHFQRLQKAIG